MGLFILVRKILVTLAPLALFYFLRKVAKKQHLPKRKSHSSGFDPSRIAEEEILEGEIVDEKK